MSVVTVSDRLVRVLEAFAPGENLEAKLGKCDARLPGVAASQVQ